LEELSREELIALVKSSGRKRGKQQGSKGNAMPWMSAPDKRVPHRPEGRCGCGTDLAEAPEVGIERSHQVHDLPEVRIKVSKRRVPGPLRVRRRACRLVAGKGVCGTVELWIEPQGAGGVSAGLLARTGAALRPIDRRPVRRA
jgi:hypothetical protein